MPDPVTWGHVLMLAGVLVGLYALWQLAIAFSNGGHGRGTPQYARARDARRSAFYAVAVAIVLILVGWATPLGGIVVSRGAA